MLDCGDNGIMLVDSLVTGEAAFLRHRGVPVIQILVVHNIIEGASVSKVINEYHEAKCLPNVYIKHSQQDVRDPPSL